MLNSLDDILQKAIDNKVCKNLVLVAAEDIYALQAIEKLTKLGLIAPIFVGASKRISKLISENKLDLNDYSIISAETPKEAIEKAVELVNAAKADIIMKGLISTKVMLKTIIKKMDGTPSSKLLSHLALFESPYIKKVFGLTDAAINIKPDITTKINIIRNAVHAFHSLGYSTPKVALLAASEKVNVKMQSSVDASDITKSHLENKIGECEIDGPLSLDIAISENAAQHKNFDSAIAGNADILIVPEINSGNILYKSLTYLGGARTAGVVLGAKSPIVLTSRADSQESKLFSVALGLNLAY